MQALQSRLFSPLPCRRVRRDRGVVPARRRLTVALLGFAALGGGCATYQPYDADADIESRARERVPTELAGELTIPYRIDETVRTEVANRVNPAWSEKRRAEAVSDFIFGRLDLEYALIPTRSAVETFEARKGNCLSFVNLFVGIARENRLNPFYVEVQDYQRWSYRDGVVISRGHIVAGMYIDGELSTFDFLPYAPKSYRDFKPIDDLTAMAHYYNNLGAEELMEGRLETALQQLEVATALAPGFDKAINNLAVAYLRSGRRADAVVLLEEGIEGHPGNVPLMSNLARAYQQEGRSAEATALFDQLEKVNKTNPFFLVYRGELALAANDMDGALDYMRRAFRADSDLPEVHVGLVKVYLALGRRDEAIHHVGRALTLDPSHTEARRYQALLRRGRTGP